ncbi:DMT family transporter [Alcaligenes endophyticus]|uniref:QacE family quaternary ammonium compound efflux SMR transporter n=1 Tax=Alcaligenes endophyticus TaxID=1929088 RepID=A0ABT8EIH1_9BURK|nr:SMR family transporter [Alcaligenes endophyticus]MCX5592560.1 SMR family transporter [Alcaligenes endophyticus]MDN4121092.1 QacE family quaternary ammonium compound efflux SMR transporter [Alcaligenes endophyticus]
MSSNTLSYLHLFCAIAFEIIGTTLLQQSQQFTRLYPSVGSLFCYGVAFYFLSLTLRSMAVGIAYALWSGIGIVLISLIGWLVFKQKIDLPAIIGISLIVAGVLVINLFSSSVH